MNAQAARWERPRLAGSDNAMRARPLLNPRIRLELQIVYPYVIGVLACLLLLCIGRQLLLKKPSKPITETVGLAITIFHAGMLPLAAAALCLQTWLAEFTSGTVPKLISEPLSRRRIWNEKFAITAAALAVCVTIALIPGVLYSGTISFYHLALIVSICLTLVCAAPWIVISMRRPLPSLLVLVLFVLVGTYVAQVLLLGLFVGRDLDHQQTFGTMLVCTAPVVAYWIYRSLNGSWLVLPYFFLCYLSLSTAGKLMNTVRGPDWDDQFSLLAFSVQSMVALLAYWRGYLHFQRLEVHS